MGRKESLLENNSNQNYFSGIFKTVILCGEVPQTWVIQYFCLRKLDFLFKNNDSLLRLKYRMTHIHRRSQGAGGAVAPLENCSRFFEEKFVLNKDVCYFCLKKTKKFRRKISKNFDINQFFL